MVICLLENSSDFSLDRGWVLCIQVFISFRVLELDSVSLAVIYIIFVDRFGFGSRREVTLFLGFGEDGMFDLFVIVFCVFFYSFREVVGGVFIFLDCFKDFFLDMCFFDVLFEQEGICLFLSEYTVDMLQCLRFFSLVIFYMQVFSLFSLVSDFVDIFLGVCFGLGSKSVGFVFLRVVYLFLLVVVIKVLAELLRVIVGDSYLGWWR